MHEGGKVEINMYEKENMAVLEFIDSGEGFPEEHLGKVFDPLFTTKQKVLVLVWQAVKIL
jgi:signal transduction histidine kinase